MRARVQCQRDGCESIFDLPADRLGRNVECPSCGGRMTARPLEVQARLRRQELEIAGNTATGIERLPLTVVVDNVRSLWNVGSIFRTADACGVRRIVLTGITGCPPRPEISKTALGAERAVTWRYESDPIKAVDRLRADGYETLALETSPRATDLQSIGWPAKVCLIVGNEVAGVSPAVLERCDVHVRIPMHGVKSSLNVAVAFGIAAHQAAGALAGNLAKAPRHDRLDR